MEREWVAISFVSGSSAVAFCARAANVDEARRVMATKQEKMALRAERGIGIKASLQCSQPRDTGTVASTVFRGNGTAV
jgi:hypothetical protein